MAVLERSELEASPLADLHAIADQLGLDGFRRLRKSDLIDAILGDSEEQEGRPPADADELGRRRDAVRGEGRAGRRAGRSARPGASATPGSCGSTGSTGRPPRRSRIGPATRTFPRRIRASVWRWTPRTPRSRRSSGSRRWAADRAP